MVKIEKVDEVEQAQEYLQCSSCLKSNEDTDMFRIIIGKTIQQTTTIKLCEECMRDLFDDLHGLLVNGQI